MLYNGKVKRSFVAFMMMFAMVFTVFSSSIVTLASSRVEATQDELAKRSLTSDVQSALQEEKYAVDGGGYLSGKDLFEGSSSEGFQLKEDEFQTLTSAAQSQLVEDIARECNTSIETNDNVSESTVQNWWKELQSLNGVGSKFLSEILKNTKPDFVTANAIYQPFSGFVGTVMGVIAVVVMAFLGIVIVSDIAYITLPPVRNLVSDSDGKGKIAKSKLFSHDAIYAVQTAEQSDSEGGKQALGIYLRRRVVALIILGICLLYLVNGQIYTLVGWILDLLSGFLGF